MSRRRPIRTALAAALLLALGVATAPAEVSPRAEIEQARALLARSAAALRKAQSGEARLAAIGRAIRAQEAALAALRRAIRELTIEEAAIRRQIAREEGRLGEVLASLQTLGRAPRSALLAYPGGPLEAARAASLMAGITPAIESRTARLADRLDRLATVRQDQATAESEARAALATLQEMRAESDRVMAGRRVPSGAMQARIRAQAEAAADGAEGLAGLAAELARLAPAGPPLGFETARGQLPLPVAGRVVASYGDADPRGRDGLGWTIEAPAYAHVVAPWDGTVRFAGRLGAYGNVVVLEPETGYLMILAGLGRLERQAGEVVLAGEKIGDMGGPLPSSDEFLFEAASDDGLIGREKLYLELRLNGDPLDPARWFEAQDR